MFRDKREVLLFKQSAPKETVFETWLCHTLNFSINSLCPERLSYKQHLTPVKMQTQRQGDFT